MSQITAAPRIRKGLNMTENKTPSRTAQPQQQDQKQGAATDQPKQDAAADQSSPDAVPAQAPPEQTEPEQTEPEKKS